MFVYQIVIVLGDQIELLYLRCRFFIFIACSPEVVLLPLAKVHIPNPVRNGGIVMNTHTVLNIVVCFLEHQVCANR